MVMSIDVTHPSPDSTSMAPSVAGMVASVDKYLRQWPADLRIQERRKEMVTFFDTMSESRLQLWKTQGKYDSFSINILIYRNGVSEGHEVAVRPEAKGRKLLHIFELLLELPAFVSFRKVFITDYKSTLISCRQCFQLSIKGTARTSL